MEKEQVTGKLDEVKGKAKQAVAGVSGNPKLHNEGVAEEDKGKLKQTYGDLKATIKDADRKAGTDLNDK